MKVVEHERANGGESTRSQSGTRGLGVARQVPDGSELEPAQSCGGDPIQYFGVRRIAGGLREIDSP